MEAPVKTIEYQGFNINIYIDDYPESPREWDNNIGKMLCFKHRNYDLGDSEKINDLISMADCKNIQEVKKELIRIYDPAIMLPLYLYDHSGLRMKVGSFQGYLSQGHAEFDSGQIGFILITKKKIREEYKVKRISKTLLNKVAKLLESEVDVYDKYISGEVYSYCTEEIDDSCCGFYDTDYMIVEAKSNIDHYIDQQRKAKQAKLKALIINKVSLLKRSNLLNFAVYNRTLL